MAIEIEVEYLGGLSTRSIHGNNREEIYTDAPIDNEGKGERFSPTDLFAASLGSCVLTIMGIYAKRLSVDMKGTKVVVTKEMAQVPPRRIKKLTLLLTSPHTFTPEITKKLEDAAEHCPVHLSLHPDIVVVFDYRWGQK